MTTEAIEQCDPAQGVVDMKYIAPVEPRHEESAGAEAPGANDPNGNGIVELTGMEYGVVGSGSRRWFGLLVGIAATVTGVGFVCHGSGPPAHGPALDPSEPAAAASATPRGVDATNGSGGTALELDPGDEPVIIFRPAHGATVTSGVTMTGGVVVVGAFARRPVGTVHASVSIGELVLGSTDVEVQTIGPFEFRIPLFPPPFAAPVVLRLHAAPSARGGGFDVFRDLRLNIPSAVGFWDTSPTGPVDARGRVLIAIRGYAPLSARTVEVAIRDGRGHEVATGSSRLAVDADLPGSAGGWILGLGSFEATLRLPPGWGDRLSLIATWRDAATGTQLHLETALAPIPLRWRRSR